MFFFGQKTLYQGFQYSFFLFSYQLSISLLQFSKIIPKPLFPDHPEFYSKFLLLNEKYHYPYTSNFCLNVLDLSQTNLATEENRSSGLLHWAQMFLANSWEELKQIAAGDPAFEEVLDNMYTVNTIPEERTIFEAHQKYQALMSALKSDKEEYAAELAKKDTELEKLRQFMISKGYDPDNLE